MYAQAKHAQKYDDYFGFQRRPYQKTAVFKTTGKK